MSSWREAVYSLLSAYHFAVQVRETPRRKPYGWTLCPNSGLLVRDDDRDVGHWLVDRERPTLCPRLEPLDRRALVGDGVDDVEVLGGQVVVVLGIGGRALEEARDVGGGLLRHDPQERSRFLDLLALDRLGHEAGLAGGRPEVLGGGGDTHGRHPTSAPSGGRGAGRPPGSCGPGGTHRADARPCSRSRRPGCASCRCRRRSCGR